MISKRVITLINPSEEALITIQGIIEKQHYTSNPKQEEPFTVRLDDQVLSDVMFFQSVDFGDIHDINQQHRVKIEYYEDSSKYEPSGKFYITNLGG